ncbi:hypothetical protein LCGC14_1214920 [marine sediment metagenome]|uniref:Uncharacterized protein n=1 Tax=marine sediment metagenome TaxID=412755 RepID=A0A0F9M0F7_9ZZZZ
MIPCPRCQPYLVAQYEARLLVARARLARAILRAERKELEAVHG